MILATDGLLDNLFTEIQLLESSEQTWMETHNLELSRQVLADLWLQQDFVDTFALFWVTKRSYLPRTIPPQPIFRQRCSSRLRTYRGQLDDITGSLPW